MFFEDPLWHYSLKKNQKNLFNSLTVTGGKMHLNSQPIGRAKGYRVNG